MNRVDQMVAHLRETFNAEIESLRKVYAPKPAPPSNFDAMIKSRLKKRLAGLQSTVDAVTDPKAKHSLQSIVDFLKEQNDG